MKSNRFQRPGATVLAALIAGASLALILGLVILWRLPAGMVEYADVAVVPAIASTTPAAPAPKPIEHIATPEPVKAVYMTACTTSESRLRNKVLELFDNTELNSIVIDLKDYTGTVSYASTSVQSGPSGPGCRIYDLPQFLRSLHERGIYAIARITVFQDPLYASLHPQEAIRRKSDHSALWHDPKGLAYINPDSLKYWNYVVDLSHEAYDIGFDEINYDYIRFPSDGDLADMYIGENEAASKADVIKNFFIYLRGKVEDVSGLASSTPKIPMSADLFGLTTSAEGDLGIGQVLENTLPYFDYVAPMVYPSHFAYNFIGIPRPAKEPYKVVNYSMAHAVMKAETASSSPAKLRPWLQDFDLGATYTPDMVRAQMQATYDAGLSSWMLWNAGSSYDKAALLPRSEIIVSTTTESSHI